MENLKYINNQELSDYLSFTKKIATEAGNVLLKYFGNIDSVNSKSTNIDLVTKADLESEKLILEFLSIETPEISVLAEESGSIGDNSDGVKSPITGSM